MKFSVAFLLVLSWISNSNSIPVGHTRSLQDDLNDFLELLPLETIVTLVQDYVKNDKEIQHVIEYMKSEDFKNLVESLESHEHVISFLEYLQESGLDVYELLNNINDFIGLPPLHPSRQLFATTGGMVGLVHDIEALLPFEKIKAMYYDKLEHSEDFKKLIDRLKSPKLQAIVDELAANKEVQHIVETLRKAGIEVSVIYDLISKILGIKFPEHKLYRVTRSLADDFEEFAALVPIDRVTQIVKEYVENDKEIQHIMEYVQSKEFKDLVEEVERIDDVLNFYNYLQESGLAIYEYVNHLHSAIGLPPLKPPQVMRKMTGGLAGLVADIKAELPLDKFRALYEEKLKTSEEFKNLVDRLKSPKFQAIIDQMLENKEFMHIVQRVKEYGIDVKAVADFLSMMLGIKFPGHRRSRYARGLNEDFQDFLALIPQNEVSQLFLEYLHTDKEVQEVFEYIQTSEFRELVKVVENIDDVINFYNYLQESGLEIYKAVNRFHDIIGLPHLNPQRFDRSVKITGGVNGLIQDVKSILPIDKIKAMYHDKLQSSPEFKNLIDRLRSPKFQAVVDSLFANKEFQEILRAAKTAGINVEAVADLLATIFGLKFPSAGSRAVGNINSDVEDFLALLPIEEMSAISMRFILNDHEVQEAVKYVASDEFKNLLIRLQKEKDISDFMIYIEESGFDVFMLLDNLNEFLGVPPFPRPSTQFLVENTGKTTGVQGMLNALRSVLPYDKIHALYEEKLETSEDFKFFIERFKQPEFQILVDKLVVNEAFIELGYEAYLHGIEIRHIVEFLQQLLGLNFPDVPFPHQEYAIRESYALNDDLMDFLDLLPVDLIVKTVLTYSFHDKETQEAIIYMRSDNFKNIVTELDSIPEYNEMLRELDAADLNVYHWIEVIHKFIGLDNEPTGAMRAVISEPGISGLIEELKKLLPYDRIKDLYYEKLETSKGFLNFVALIKSNNFQIVTNNLFANKDFQHLLHDAKSHGVNLQSIADFFLRVFGITTPSGVIDS